MLGNNENGRLGLGTTTSPIPTSSPEFVAVKVDSDTTKKVKYISAGDFHTCVLLDDEVSAKCVGKNFNGGLGQGDNSPRGYLPTNTMDNTNFLPISLGTGTLKIKNIDAGTDNTCVLFEDFGVKCFGFGNYGRLGSGSPSPIGTLAPQIGNSLKFVDIFETTSAPTKDPTRSPIKNPTKNPTNNPTKSPTINPRKGPKNSPKNAPITQVPTKSPSKSPDSVAISVGITIPLLLGLFLFGFYFNKRNNNGKKYIYLSHDRIDSYETVKSLKNELGKS